MSVDLAPLLTGILDSLLNHQAKIATLESEVAYLKTLSTDVEKSLTKDTQAMLYQNIPNPASEITKIQFYIPQQVKTARIKIYNINGVVFKDITISNRGSNFIYIDTNELVSGHYYYCLIIDGAKVGAKKMIVTK